MNENSWSGMSGGEDQIAIDAYNKAIDDAIRAARDCGGTNDELIKRLKNKKVLK